MSLLVCRICLAFDVRVYTIANSPLQEIYEKLTNLQFQSGDGRPKTVCYICYYQLKKCNHFMQMSVKSDQLLSQWLSTGIELTEKSLNMASDRSCLISWGLDTSPMEYITSVVPENEVKVPIKLESMKTELSVLSDIENSELNEDFSSFDNPIHDTSDSEDDIPLQNICKKIIEASDVKKEVKERDLKISKCKNVASFSPKTNEAIPVDENKNQVIIEKCTGKQDAVQDKSKPLKRKYCRKQGNHNNKKTKKKISRYTVERNSTTIESCQSKNINKKSNNRNDLINNSKVKSHHQSTNIFICDVCKKKFIFKNQLESHIQTHELKVASKDNLKLSITKDNLRNVSSNVIKCYHCKQGKGNCNICNIKQNSSIVTLKGNQKTYECNQSGKYAKRGKLKTHVSANSGVKPHKCDICDKAFTWFSHLKRHIIIHSRVKPHKCDICDKAFTLEGTMKGHLLFHSGVKPHKCDICDKAFTLSRDLKRHILVHSGVKPHKCDICDKAFTLKGNLKRHLLYHSGVKPHKCDICDKAFTLEGTLKGHLLFHSGVKPHKCDICDKAFTLSSDLKRHLLVHSGIKPHKCKVCNKAFAKSRYLKRHLLVHSANSSFGRQTPQM